MYVSASCAVRFVQIMARHLLSDDPSSEPMMFYCQLNPKEHISISFEIQKFSFEKMHLKMSSAKMVTILCRPQYFKETN